MEFKRKKGGQYGCAWISSYRGQLVKFVGESGAWTATLGEHKAHASTMKSAYERVTARADALAPTQAPAPAPKPEPSPEAVERRARLEQRIEREARAGDLRDRRSFGGQTEALGKPIARTLAVVLPEGVVLAIMLVLLPLIALAAGVRYGYHATRKHRAALAPKLATARGAGGAGVVRGLYYGAAALALAVAAVVVIASHAGTMME